MAKWNWQDELARKDAEIERLTAQIERIQDEWEMAFYGDMENGVASLNDIAHRAFVASYPNIAAFGATLANIVLEGDDA